MSETAMLWRACCCLCRWKSELGPITAVSSAAAAHLASPEHQQMEEIVQGLEERAARDEGGTHHGG